jgi:CHASE2 domain-containing sensor protein
MDLQFILSILVSIFSLALVLIGIPAQIQKNYQEKRSGQPLLTILIALGFYASSIGFFILTRAWLPLASFSVGIVMWGATLMQWLIYEKGRMKLEKN